MKIGIWKWIAVGLFWVVPIWSLNFFSLYAHDSKLAQMRFHFDYQNASDQSAFLDGFRARLWQHGGGTIPSEVDAFLVARLESSQSEREVDAVTRFYCRQAGGREGDTWRRLSDKARRRVARSVLLNWRSLPPSDAGHAFVWLEELRLNQLLFKANLIVPSGVPNGFADSPEKIAPVAALFEKWNRKYAALPFVKRPDPLAETSYYVQGL